MLDQVQFIIIGYAFYSDGENRKDLYIYFAQGTELQSVFRHLSGSSPLVLSIVLPILWAAKGKKIDHSHIPFAELQSPEPSVPFSFLASFVVDAED